MTVAGVQPRTVVEPATVEALSACVAELYARDVPFAFAGGETEIELGNRPHALDTVVKTTACNRIIEYAPQDQTITIEAGMTIADVNDLLAKQHQFLALDVADPERVTIGGAIATNAYGRRRLRYGGIKDTIVGVTIVRPDGTRARGGGKVVKNVAGFDLPKLMTGSLGTLGAIVSATFRVYPIEEQRAAVSFRSLDISQVMQVCGELVDAQLVPASVVAYEAPGAGRYDCVVAYEGFARGVEQQVKATTSIAFRLGLSAGAFAAALTAGFDDREAAVRRGAAWRVTLSAAPSHLAAFLAERNLASYRRVLYPLLGTAFIAADTLDAQTIAQWRAALPDGSVVVHALPSAFRTTVETWGQPRPGALAVMRRLKSNFDPKGLCNAGRFVGGL